MILVSIVIPTYGRPGSLARCLASIRMEAEGDPDMEIIVVDDGSREKDSRQNHDACDRFGARYFCPGGNHGMAAARNSGISIARGEWFLFLDDDVTVDSGWHDSLSRTLRELDPGAAGFEGRIVPSGNGVWDREVSNIRGGAYLTGHLCLRRSTIDNCGPFDSSFEFLGPFCEDHELAARALQWGPIPFIADLSVTHAPRAVSPWKYLTAAPARCKKLLSAERHFHRRHPDRYHLFRCHRTFWGTLFSIMTRNAVNELRRRSAAVLVRHPFQTLGLTIGSLIEQAASWFMFPVLLAKSTYISRFRHSIDLSRSSSFMHQIPGAEPPRVKRRPVATLTFPLLRRPVYDIVPALRSRTSGSTPGKCAVFFRMDDMFTQDAGALLGACAIFTRYHCPFLAAITGRDLADPGSGSLFEEIRAAGGVIGIHGFNHSGMFGPFPSELLQMTFPEILGKVDAIRRNPLLENSPSILVPPFNAIGPEQILILSRHFDVICGGPETVRFTDGVAGPVSFKGGGWYFPSLHPFYGSCRSMLRYGAPRLLRSLSGAVCLTTHLTVEAEDRFSALAELLASLQETCKSWNIFRTAGINYHG